MKGSYCRALFNVYLWSSLAANNSVAKRRGGGFLFIVQVDPGASGGAGIDSDFARSISNTAWAARCPVDSTLRCRLLQALCGSGAAANLFPAGLRCGIIAVFDQGSSSKLRFGGKYTNACIYS